MLLVSYAQHEEDLRLYRALKQVRRGHYIDVGAQHPSVHSVTKLFYELGWSGINLEPVPGWFDQIAADRPRDVNLCVAASNAAGKAMFHEIVATGLSTLVDRYAERHAASGWQKRSYAVATRRLDDICRAHARRRIHFLKIDAEGAETKILEGCDFTRFRPWVIVVEATEPLTQTPTYAEWEPILFAAGYEYAATDQLNRFYVARERRDLKAVLAISGPIGPIEAEPSAAAVWSRRLAQGARRALGFARHPLAGVERLWRRNAP